MDIRWNPQRFAARITEIIALPGGAYVEYEEALMEISRLTRLLGRCASCQQAEHPECPKRTCRVGQHGQTHTGRIIDGP